MWILFALIAALVFVALYILFSNPNSVTPEDEKEFNELSLSDNKNTYPSAEVVVETLMIAGIEPNYLGE